MKLTAGDRPLRKSQNASAASAIAARAPTAPPAIAAVAMVPVCCRCVAVPLAESVGGERAEGSVLVVATVALDDCRLDVVLGPKSAEGTMLLRASAHCVAHCIRLETGLNSEQGVIRAVVVMLASFSMAVTVVVLVLVTRTRGLTVKVEKE